MLGAARSGSSALVLCWAANPVCHIFPGAAGGSASAGARQSEGHQNRAEEQADTCCLPVTPRTPGLNFPGGSRGVQPRVREQGG